MVRAACRRARRPARRRGARGRPAPHCLQAPRAWPRPSPGWQRPGARPLSGARRRTDPGLWRSRPADASSTSCAKSGTAPRGTSTKLRALPHFCARRRRLEALRALHRRAAARGVASLLLAYEDLVGAGAAAQFRRLEDFLRVGDCAVDARKRPPRGAASSWSIFFFSSYGRHAQARSRARRAPLDLRGQLARRRRHAPRLAVRRARRRRQRPGHRRPGRRVAAAGVRSAAAGASASRSRRLPVFLRERCFCWGWDGAG